MLNTPKSKNRLSYTRSQTSINSQANSQINQKYLNKSQHASLQKQHQHNYSTNYKMILNKMLTITNYSKFITFTSKFIDKQILQCKQQPHRLTNTRGINFITDGIFIRKLAEISQQPKQVIKHFINHVRNNKGILKQYQKNLIKQQQIQTNQQYEQNNSKQLYCNQTQQQRQQRLLGYSKTKPTTNQDKDKQKQKQTKIVYSQYIKSNRKSMQIYQKVKKKLQQQATLISNQKQHKKQQQQQKQSLKRLSINQYKIKYKNPVQQLTNQITNKLTQIQRQILNMFTSIKYLIISSNQVTEYKNVQYLGKYKNNKIWRVLLEFRDCYWMPWEGQDSVIQHAITLQPIDSENVNINVNEIGNGQVKIDNFVRYFYRKQSI